MSTGDDNLFARWSRRKQAARKAEDPARSAAEAQAAGPLATEADVTPADQQLPAEETAASEPPEPLPSVEDLTVESDLTAFLRKGIPEPLKRAALRKMWSLDPAIRDHVGLAECTWDFNQPGSVPGFGSLGAAGSAPDFLSRPVIAQTADPEVPVPAGHAAESTTTPAGRTASVDTPDMAPPQEVAASDPQADPGAEADRSPSTMRSTAAGRHGGALPRD